MKYVQQVKVIQVEVKQVKIGLSCNEIGCSHFMPLYKPCQVIQTGIEMGDTLGGNIKIKITY